MKKVLAAGGLVFNDQKELLMIYRHGKWDLPKGHLEKGESLEECALREVEEETALRTLSITGFVGITEHTYYDSDLKEEAVKEVHWFAMHATKDDDIHPQLQEGIEWLRWIGRSDIYKFLYSTYHNIREIVGKALDKS